jgi:hypothetical protein
MRQAGLAAAALVLPLGWSIRGQSLLSGMCTQWGLFSLELYPVRLQSMMGAFQVYGKPEMH